MSPGKPQSCGCCTFLAIPRKRPSLLQALPSFQKLAEALAPCRKCCWQYWEATTMSMDTQEGTRNQKIHKEGHSECSLFFRDFYDSHIWDDSHPWDSHIWRLCVLPLAGPSEGPQQKGKRRLSAPDPSGQSIAEGSISTCSQERCEPRVYSCQVAWSGKLQ